MDWKTFRDGKLYDLMMGLPLILWFGNAAVQLRPRLVMQAHDILAGEASNFTCLQFAALSCAALFNLLLVYLVVVRDRPVLRAAGWVPRLCGFLGTFLGVGILHLPVADLTLGWQTAAAVLVGLGSLGSAIVLATLGKSFSIMPEARKLVTGGPYALARHPLYAVEMLSLAGTAVQFAQPWAALLALAVLALQVTRSMFEERVLAAAFPDYADYRRRVKRFGIV